MNDVVSIEREGNDPYFAVSICSSTCLITPNRNSELCFKRLMIRCQMHTKEKDTKGFPFYGVTLTYADAHF